MEQVRNKTGITFEKLICEEKGWKHNSKSPKIVWAGFGRNNFQKIAFLDFKANKFIPTSDSIFEKYDAITKENEKIEIKKYDSKYLKNWVLYSEPIIKVTRQRDIDNVTKYLGNGDVSLGKEKYNKFIEELQQYIGDDILKKIITSNIGVQLKDKFIPQSELEYCWVIKRGWMGYNRLSIEFKLKTPC
jgi:hypothetical protein